ncbi:MAG: NAD(P)H-dependent oxidoreductase [Candidatus Bathyarchaeota archaeon]|nr:NAD(P)H-dependent oxidoreductase [Candidatus Bathyarchaeota archaeon]
MGILVAYYSRTGTTQFVAEKIAEQLSAETCEVVDKKSRKGILAFVTGGYESRRKKLTEIDLSKTIDNYDFIIIGSPVWSDGITPAIRAFIAKNEFSGKQVAIFVTLKGNNPAKALANFKEALHPEIPVAELGIKDNVKNREQSEQHILNWCEEITQQIDVEQK